MSGLAEQSYERTIARDARNRTAPPKLKVVSDVLTTRAKPPSSATGTKPASTTTAVPTDPKAGEPAAATTQPLVEAPAIPTNEAVK